MNIISFVADLDIDDDGKEGDTDDGINYSTLVLIMKIYVLVNPFDDVIDVKTHIKYSIFVLSKMAKYIHLLVVEQVVAA